MKRNVISLEGQEPCNHSFWLRHNDLLCFTYKSFIVRALRAIMTLPNSFPYPRTPFQPIVTSPCPRNAIGTSISNSTTVGSQSMLNLAWSIGWYYCIDAWYAGLGVGLLAWLDAWYAGLGSWPVLNPGWGLWNSCWLVRSMGTPCGSWCSAPLSFQPSWHPVMMRASNH